MTVFSIMCTMGNLAKSKKDVLDAMRKAALPEELIQENDRNMGEKGEKVSRKYTSKISSGICLICLWGKSNK